MSESLQPEPINNQASSSDLNNDLFVVGIGASAGGLSALEELFDNLSTASGAAFVVIQHLSPDFKSLMKELLERRTSMPVYRVKDGMSLKANSVYLIPPGQNLVLEKNVLHLEDRHKDKNHKHEHNFPIDLFFSSLAKHYGEKSIGVILSGSGSDGTRGLKAINEAGGLALVQDPETAEFDGMPRSAIATGVVNQILPPRKLAQLIYHCIITPISDHETESQQENLIQHSHLRQITQLLRKEGFDFSQYKFSTISRRIHRRCLIHNTNNINQYIRLLNDSAEERQILCSDLLINVTHFFRDHPAWQNLENNILPRLIEQSEAETELRFWVTACSTGEEAYSLAILIYEALQDSAKNIRVKIFATDIDRIALDKASQGIYSASIARDIGSERLQRYFVPKGNSFQIMRKIREMLIFSLHDLTKDAGFTRINLITCRNVLIYMKSDLQYQVLRSLHFCLTSQGILFLGEAETLGDFESEFKPIDQKWKFFQKKRDIRLSLPLRSTPKIDRDFINHFSQPQTRSQIEPILEQCLNRLSETSNTVILLINQENHLLHVSGDSSKIFKAPGGKITTEVIKMVVSPLQLPLSTALHRAKQKNKLVQYQGIKLEYQGEHFQLSLEVIPPSAIRNQGDFFLVKIKPQKSIVPLEISREETFELDSEASQRILELEDQLLQTRENLQALVEELETTNEEQQASNEELTASNEELQSTNEELHSVNEELHTVNIEYQSKISELIQLNNDIDNLLKSTEIGVIFLDSNLRIRKFTPAATQAISLRDTDLERPLSELTLKVDCPQLPKLLKQVLTKHQSIDLEVQHQTNQTSYLMKINPYSIEDGKNDGLVISFVTIDTVKKVQLELEQTFKELEKKETEINNFFKLSLEMMCVATLEGYFLRCNPSFEQKLGYTVPELLAQPFIDFVHPEDSESTLQQVKKLETGKLVIGFENRYRCKNGSFRWLRWMATAHQGLIYATAYDFTKEKIAHELLNRQLAAMETARNGIAILKDDKFVYLNQAHVEMFGYSQAEELIGQYWQILYREEDLFQFEQEVFPVLQAQGKWHGVVKAKHRSGKTFDEELTLSFSASGDLICVCQDITTRLKDERKLRSQKAQLSKLNRNLEYQVAQRTQTLANFSDHLKQLHRLAISEYGTLEELYAQYLQTGCAIFGLTTGIVSKITGSVYEVLGINSDLDIPVGAEFNCQDTYCEEIIRQRKTVAYYDVSKIDQLQNHPVYLNLHLNSYIGTPIFINGSLYGTLNFSDTAPRLRKFSASELEIIELLASNISSSLSTMQSEMRLKQSEAEFRQTFEQATVGITHVGLDGKFLKVNSKLCEILGYSNQELLKIKFQDITYPEDLALDQKYVPLIMAGEMSSCTYEKRYIHADGSIIWANLTFCMVEATKTKPAYFIVIVEDIGDRKQAEIALLEASKAKDTFIAHMSHELRTPLNSVIGFSNILSKDGDLTAKQLKSVEIINQSGQHLLTLINDVLALSKLNANKLELKKSDVQLFNFLQDIASIFQTRAQEKGLEFNLQTSDNLPLVINTDETRLRQVLFNLLSNAIKFTDTGKITFSVNCLTQDNSIYNIRFQVEDTGAGIPQDKYETVFAPFGQLNQSSNDSEGTGLGIPICQNILQLMNSQLNLGSKLGQGSLFWFDLELVGIQDPHPVPIASHPQSRISQSHLLTLLTTCKVLIVDDNQDNRILLVEYLKPLGFTIQEANNGAAGLEIATNFYPDVILVDLLMPIMNGKEMIEQIRQHPELKETVIIMISANAQSIIDSSDIQCDGFLAKPLELPNLIEVLTRLLQLEWQTQESEIATINSSWVLPELEQLNQLLELANGGNMDALLAQINQLEITNSQYSEFINQIRQLADSCQQDYLEQLLQTSINQLTNNQN